LPIFKKSIFYFYSNRFKEIDSLLKIAHHYCSVRASESVVCNCAFCLFAATTAFDGTNKLQDGGDREKTVGRIER